MERILSITAASGAFIVALEGGERYVVEKSLFAPIGVAEGDALDEEALDALVEASLQTAAIMRALDILSYSNASRKALIDKLRLKYKVAPLHAEAAADYALRRGYIDEAAQAEKYAGSAVRTKCWGRARVMRELAAKGYSKEICAEAADSVTENEYREALRCLVGKKINTAPRERREVDRTVSSLVRLGHQPRDIKAALEERIKELER